MLEPRHSQMEAFVVFFSRLMRSSCKTNRPWLQMTEQTDIFDQNCAFCKIVRDADGLRVFEDEHTVTFLDHRPLFPGHCLLIPRSHFQTIQDLPDSLLAPLLANVRMLSAAIEVGMHAQGTFIAANNRVSQSVPHFHVHIVPRTKGDGLKGFFWPRRKYKSADEIDEVLRALRAAIAQVRSVS
jgi:histidine triad (HIT) family protein